MKKIFIDAGHNNSGWNTGALGNGMREQDITFEVAFLLGELLKRDFEIRLSRPTLQTNLGTDNNSAINARWQMSNQWGADYFISIHANAGGGTGAETFFFDEAARNFATTVQNTYTAEMGLRSRRTELASQFAVIRETKCPATLLELAFIDSPLTNPDIEILRNKRPQMAQAIANGIYKFFGITPKPPTPPAPPPPPTPEPPPAGKLNIDIRGTVMPIRGHIVDGETWVRLTEFCTALGFNATWDGERRIPVVRCC